MKKIVSLVLSLLMLLSIFPATAFAEDETLELTVNSANAVVGSTLNVNVSLSNNPGIAALKVKLNYDSDLLTLNSVTYNTEMGGSSIAPQQLASPVTLQWFIGTADISYNGVFATLSFSVNESLTSDEVTTITVSYDEEDITNTHMETVPMTVQDGTISIYMVRPGDINGDAKTNNKDLVCFAQYLADWAVSVNEAALDTNGDGKINNKDLVLLAQYLADWDVEIFPKVGPIICNHSLSHIDATDATCVTAGAIEYWKCTKCGKFFGDASASKEISLESTIIAINPNNHVHQEVIPAKAPTYTETGNYEGWRCLDCGKSELTIIPILEKETYAITYHEAGNDVYLLTLNLRDKNTNPATYQEGNSFTLKELTVPGYTFEGWYDGQGANATRISRITADMTGSIELYAHWTPIQYTVSYDCGTFCNIASAKYYTSEGLGVLPTPDIYGYSFICWMDQNGKIIDDIPAGSVGSFALTAKWGSQRNQAVQLSSPIALTPIVDEKNMIMIFPYEIGDIQNVPINVIKNLGNASAVEITESVEYTASYSRQEAENASKTVSAATTNNREFKLSSDWNSCTQVSESASEEYSQADITRYTNSSSSHGSFSISKDKGGSSVQKDGKKWTQSASLSASTEKIIPVKIEAEVKASRDTTHEHTDTATWNTKKSFEAGVSSSHSSEVSRQLNTSIASQRGYASSTQNGGSSSNVYSTGDSSSESSTIASSTTYGNTSTQKTSMTYHMANMPSGYYRLVLAGTYHVFAVVVYDINSATFSVFTYNVLDDNTYEFVDFSKTDSTFSGPEKEANVLQGRLDFSVPFSVNTYVGDRVVGTEGLQIDTETGIITGYSGTDTDVLIPEYLRVDNGNGSYKAYKVTGIASTAFQGNETITSVTCCKNITAIPENAFAGCVNLTTVDAAYVTSIGAGAFINCTSLNEYVVGTEIDSLGNNAFTNVPSVKVNAANIDVAKAAVASGAKRISLNMANVPSNGDVSTLSNTTLHIGNGTDYFEFAGAEKVYNDVKIVSAAAVTEIKEATFNGGDDIIMKLSSPTVTLNTVAVNSQRLAVELNAENNVLQLKGTVRIITSAEDAILSKNVDFREYSSSSVGRLNVTGNIEVYGSYTGQDLVTGNLRTIDQTTYDVLKDKWEHDPFTITFDANGGETSITSKTAERGTPIGSLPVPTKENYEFIGWFTDDGTTVTEQTIFNEATTIIAHWYALVWSDWSTEEPPENAIKTESKTQYQYRDKQFQTSSEEEMEGWEPNGTTQKWGDWSDWSTASASASDTVQVETRTTYRLYYFECSSCHYHNAYYADSCGGCGKNTVKEESKKIKWVDTPYSQMGSTSYASGKKRKVESIEGGPWYFNAEDLNKTSPDDYIRIEYRKSILETIYSFYRYTDWSEWTDAEIVAEQTDTFEREVATRLLYRYQYSDYQGAQQTFTPQETEVDSEQAEEVPTEIESEVTTEPVTESPTEKVETGAEQE